MKSELNPIVKKVSAERTSQKSQDYIGKYNNDNKIKQTKKHYITTNKVWTVNIILTLAHSYGFSCGEKWLGNLIKYFQLILK